MCFELVFENMSSAGVLHTSILIDGSTMLCALFVSRTLQHTLPHNTAALPAIGVRSVAHCCTLDEFGCQTAAHSILYTANSRTQQCNKN